MSLSPTNFADCMREPLMTSLHERNFKNGAFKSLIPFNTPIIVVFSTLINSPLLSATEKGPFESCRDGYIRLRVRLGREPDLHDVQMYDMGTFHAWNGIFDVIMNDALRQGWRFGPVMARVIGADGAVRETAVVQGDGSMTVVSGGLKSPNESGKGNKASAAEEKRAMKTNRKAGSTMRAKKKKRKRNGAEKVFGKRVGGKLVDAFI